MVTKIDIFGLGSTPHDEVEFAHRRRVKVRASGAELWIKSPEDTILRKLLWYREGGQVSDKQWHADVSNDTLAGRLADARLAGAPHVD